VARKHMPRGCDAIPLCTLRSPCDQEFTWELYLSQKAQGTWYCSHHPTPTPVFLLDPSPLTFPQKHGKKKQAKI